MNRLLVSLLVLLGSLLAGCSRPHTFAGTELDPAPLATDFAGTNWNGTPFQLKALQEEVVLLFFGYTSCPDVCPTTLAEMKKLYDLLGEDAQDVAVVLVTVDPERDTVARLAEYVPAFNAAFYGVFLESDVLEETKRAYGIFAQKAESGSAPTAAGYLVDHTASLLVLDRQGRWRLLYSFGTTAEEMLSDIRYLLQA